jgi:hypothetical protein
MKQLMVCGFSVILLGLAGCGQQSGKISSQPSESNTYKDEPWDGTPPAQDALPDFLGDPNQWGVFPESMVGVWEVNVTESTKWGIKFEPDGSILRLEHVLAGEIKMEEGGAYIQGPDEENYIMFVMGPCEARYIPETGIIKVKIILDYYLMKLPAGELEGRTEDYFEGPVSKDGKTWTVDWREYGWLEGASPPDAALIKANPVKLVFTKLDLTQSKQGDDVR